MKLQSCLTVGILGLGLLCAQNFALAAPHTLKGGSEYEKSLEQAGMSGMSGMSSTTGTSAGEPAKAGKKAAKKAKHAKGSAKKADKATPAQ